MSELKVYEEMEDYVGYDECDCTPAKMYDKSEADKAFAEKDKEIMELKGQVNGFKNISNLWHYNAIEEHKKFVQIDLQMKELKSACKDKDDWCLHTLKQLRHQKYKRCLAMAEACMHKRWRTDEGFDYARSTRQMKKCLEIAEKFKEAK